MPCRLDSLKAQRELAGLSRDALARKANVGLRTIVTLESPHPSSSSIATGGSCDDHVAARIADALGVSLVTLGQAKL